MDPYEQRDISIGRHLFTRFDYDESTDIVRLSRSDRTSEGSVWIEPAPNQMWCVGERSREVRGFELHGARHRIEDEVWEIVLPDKSLSDAPALRSAIVSKLSRM